MIILKLINLQAHAWRMHVFHKIGIFESHIKLFIYNQLI